MKLLLNHATLLLGGGKYISDGAVVVENGRITYVGDKPDLNEINNTPGDYISVINCKGGLLMPAFYNIHCHTPMTLFRGVGEDLPLQRWLNEKIYPAEDKLTPESVRIGSMIAAAEMIRGGVVSFSDMYFFCPETAKVVLDTGMKANIARCLLSFDENDGIAGNERFDEARSLVEEYHNAADERLKVDMSVHAEYTNKAKFCSEVADYTHTHNLNMQVHVSETELEHEECKARNNGMTPTEFLLKTGILTPASDTSTATAAHCVWTTEHDMELLAENNVTVAHNPVSNLKLASGIAPVEKMLAHGVRVGLGTDGAASNNRLSVIRELQTAALIHKGVTRRADVIPTWQFFDMATRAGAIAQGRNDCGELKVGYRADLTLISLDDFNNIPMFDPYSALAFSVDPKDVRMTMCDGKILYKDGSYTTIDVEKLRAEAKPILEHYFD